METSLVLPPKYYELDRFSYSIGENFRNIVRFIGDGSLTTAMLADDSVTNAKLADDAVDTAQLADGAVDTDRLAADAVTGAKIADDAVDTEHIADDAVGAAAVDATEVPTLAANNTFTGDNAITGFLGVGASDSLTIASGAITVTNSYAQVDTESAAATDDLDTINGGSEGDQLFIRTVTASRVVTLKNGTGNLLLGTDVVMNSSADCVHLFKVNSSSWVLIGYRDI